MIPPTLILATLLAGWSADAPDSIKSIDESYQTSVKRLNEAKTEAEEKTASAEFQALRATLVGRAIGLAEEHPGSPESVDALTWVIHYARGNSEPRLKALELLRRDSLASEGMGEACRWAANSFGKESIVAEQLLREVSEKNPHPKVRGRAVFGLAELLESRADFLRDLGSLPPAYRKGIGEEAIQRMAARTVDDLVGESEALYDQVARTNPDLEHPRTGKPLGAVAEGRVFRLRNLSIGRAIPEIEGVDVEGKPLKLTDYRGQVIVLTFSGIWCPSCHVLYPQQRELLQRYKGRPFAVLSVNTDEGKDPLRKAIASGEINWPCWWDGGVGGPITVRNGIYYFPTLFLIDRQGVVRFKDIQGPELDQAIERLMNEAG